MTPHRDHTIDWLEIESSAPGKIIISGEHSVVYDKQAIAAAIDLRTKCIIRPTKDGLVRLFLRDLGYVWAWPVTSLSMTKLISRSWECLSYEPSMANQLNNLLNHRYIQSPKPNPDGESFKKAKDAALAFLLLYIGLGDSFASSFRPSLDVDVQSQIPIGSGLGSSAAYAVALCGALLKVFLVSAEPYIISNWAFNVDKFFHTKPSGVDNSIVTSGGYILFQSGRIKSSGAAHRESVRGILIDTCVSRSSREAGASVAAQLNEDLTKVNGLFNSINELTSQIWRKINDREFHPRGIDTSLRGNQELLTLLGVSHPKLDDICLRAENFNLAAKMTGAGSGGHAFVLYDETDDLEHIDEFKVELSEAGYKVHDCRVGCEGLKVKITPDPDKI